jgi:hypothetical protein
VPVSPPDWTLLLAYRLLGWRLGPEHRAWTYRDITGRGYLLRQGLPLLAAVGSGLALVLALAGSDPRRVLPPVLGVLLLLALLRRSVVERALRQQGLTPDGEVDPGARAWFDDAQERRRRSVASATTTAVLVLGGLLVLGLGPAE